MFVGTFYSCTGLTSLPKNLFSGVSDAKQNMFQNTFRACKNLGGYIPPSTFARLIANGSPTTQNMWSNTFYKTVLDTSCPSDTTEYNTGYKTYWGGYVSCRNNMDIDCASGQYLPANIDDCTQCPTNSICSGGTYSFNETVSQGIQSCASGTFAPTGSTVCYPHIFHVGDDIVYIKSVKQTTPSLNIQIGNDIFYINMTTTRTRMSKDSTHYFHVDYGGNHYYVCDDTTCPNAE